MLMSTSAQEKCEQTEARNHVARLWCGEGQSSDRRVFSLEWCLRRVFKYISPDSDKLRKSQSPGGVKENSKLITAPIAPLGLEIKSVSTSTAAPRLKQIFKTHSN